MNDADMELALMQSNMGMFINMGQCCFAGTRLFVHEQIYDESVERSVAAAKSAVMGDPLEPTTSQGPQINETQANRIKGYIQKGKDEGAKLLAGGGRPDRKGYFVEQTVFADV